MRKATHRFCFELRTWSVCPHWLILSYDHRGLLCNQPGQSPVKSYTTMSPFATLEKRKGKRYQHIIYSFQFLKPPSTCFYLANLPEKAGKLWQIAQVFCYRFVSAHFKDSWMKKLRYQANPKWASNRTPNISLEQSLAAQLCKPQTKTPQLPKLSAPQYSLCLNDIPAGLLNLIKQTGIADYTISCLLWSAVYQ